MRSPVEQSGAPTTPATGFTPTGYGEGNAGTSRRRIQVWFGNEVICSHEAEPSQAKRYAALMSRRFAGLRVTIDDNASGRDRKLPNELLWESTVM